jgi:outer membrane immunogenic protein
MRRVMIGLGMLGLAQSALAADLDPYLRGSSMPTYHWGGLYAGAQVGYSSATYDFSNGVSSLLSFILGAYPTLASDVSGWNVFGQSSTNGATYGGFAGYNVEWEDVILGVEFNYNRSSLFKSASNTASGPDPNPFVLSANEYYLFNNVTVNGSTSIKITDLATLRGRAGWEIGQFLPYAFGAVAIGRANVTQSASASASYSDWLNECVTTLGVVTCTFTPLNGPGTALPLRQLAFAPQATTQTGEFVYGGAAGLGVDMALMSNAFLRLEWEYLLFAPINGIHANVNSLRTALGVLF